MKIPRRVYVNVAVALVALVSALLAGRGTVTRGAPANGAPPEDGTPVRVVSVADGDTFDAVGPNGAFTVRVLGIDTPETVKPGAPVDCYGPEASAQARALLAGELVRLEADPTQDNRDRYGRYLRHVSLPDGADLGETLIAGGFAREYTYRKKYERQQSYRALQAEAKEARRGLWGACTPKKRGEH